jgi:hypothetical protein
LILSEDTMRIALKSASIDALMDEIRVRFREMENRLPKMDESDSKMYSVPDVAAVCKVKISSVQRWVREKTYPAKKMGRAYYFTEETFNRIKAERGLK